MIRFTLPVACLLAVFSCVGAAAAGLCNVAQTSLGATAVGTGAPFNKGWPANNAIPQEDPRNKRGGVLFGAPMEGAEVTITLLTPCAIERVDLMQLDYHETMCVKDIEIAVDGKVVKTVALEEKPGAYQEIPLLAKGRRVAVKCLSTYPARLRKDGSKGPNYGGWARIRVQSSDDFAAMIAPPESYAVTAYPASVMPTGTAAAGPVKVFGEPRVAKGHPCTTWDKEDVARFRAMLKTSSVLQDQAKGLREAMDKRILKPVSVPQPKFGPDGKPVHVSDSAVGKIHNALALDLANLGTCYQLFGDEKYAAYARKLLLAYAEAWPNYGVGARAGFSHDPSKVFDQRLSDATWLIQVAIGYDFVRESACFTAADRAKIEKDLVAGDAYFISQNHSQLRGATNWSAIACAAILTAGYACEDEELVRIALYGTNWTDRRPKRKGDPLPVPNKWWEGTPNARPSGVELHFSEKSIDVDGMWCEGAMGYQFMALQALVLDAEVLWRHGIDLYRYRDCALKCIFDSPLSFAYPNLIAPAIHDSGNAPIVGYNSGLYEYGYLRYRDPKYLEVLRRIGRRLAASFQLFTISTLYDTDVSQAGTVVEPASVNLNGVGYGILRATDEKGTRNLLLDYGPNRSHGHPDKLNLDLWAFGELQIPDPGSVWYEQPIYRNWYRTTFAHNTLSVDLQEQNACGAELLAYAAGDAFGLMRARTADAYPGVTMDRTVFLTRDYVADLFGAFSRMPRTYDLAWHPRGDGGVPQGAEGRPFVLPEPRAAGYSELKDLHAFAVPKQGLVVPFDNKGLATALHVAAGDAETTLVSATADIKPNAPAEHPVFARRITSETIFGTVFDLSGRSGNIASVTQEGSAQAGYGRLTIRKADGSCDVCFAVTKENALAKGDAQVSSDAQVGFWSLDADGQTIRTIALAGGTMFQCGATSLKLSDVGGAVVERTETGSYLVRNTSSVVNDVTFADPGLSVTFALQPGETREYLPTGATPIAEHKAAVLKRLAEESAAAEAKRQAEIAARVKVRTEQAAKEPAPKGTRIILQAEDFTETKGGELMVTDRKTAAVGTSFSRWDPDGMSVSWKVNVPAAGYYRLSLVYCSDVNRTRAITVNGLPVADSEAEIPASGGFSNGADNWRVFTFPEKDGKGALPVRFEAGENTLTLTNVGGGGVNLDYLLITSSDVVPERIK